MAEIANADIETLYSNCLVIYKGALVRVMSIDYGDDPVKFTILNLSTQKRQVVPFKLEDFKSPEKRIGFVNIMQSCVYVARLPVRKYHFGINYANIEIRCPAVRYPHDRVSTKDMIRKLNSVEIYNAYAGKYPSLQEATENARKWNGACAFDKQFCVNYNGDVFYKEIKVGVVDNNAIKFEDKYSYLEIVLEDNYEKTSRTFRATPL